MQPLIATVVTWVCAVAFAFVVNKVFVFRNKSAKKREWLKQAAAFYAARLATLALETGFIAVTVMLLVWNEALMIIIAQVFILIGNYVLSKFVIFAKKKTKNRDSGK
jgi:putative flippase GtrA